MEIDSNRQNLTAVSIILLRINGENWDEAAEPKLFTRITRFGVNTSAMETIHNPLRSNANL